MYRISVCDDNSSELEKICSIISGYTEANNITAEIKTFSSGSELLEYEGTNCRSDIYSSPPERFALKCASNTMTVNAEDIVYIEYYNHHMIYRLAGGKTVESIHFRGTFDSMIGDYIKNGSFIKSSASYLVNMKHIKTVNSVGFIMSDGTLLTVTRKYADARKKYIDYELNGGERQ